VGGGERVVLLVVAMILSIDSATPRYRGIYKISRWMKRRERRYAGFINKGDAHEQLGQCGTEVPDKMAAVKHPSLRSCRC
jgi:hypothetical protein